MKWWKNLNVYSRLMLLFTLLALVGAINAVIGINNVVRFNEQLYDLQRYLDSYGWNATAQTSLVKAKSAIQSYLLSPEGTPQDQTRYQAEFYRAEGQLWDYLDTQVVNAYYEEGSESKTEALTGGIDQLSIAAESVLVGETLDSSKVNLVTQDLESQVAAFSRDNLKDMKDLIADIESSVQSSATVGQAVLFVLVILILLGVYLVNHISRPLASLTSAIVAFQNNTFKPEMLEPYTQRKDELGYLARSVSAMAESITESNRIKQTFIESASRFIPAEYLDFLEKPDITKVELGDHVAAEMAVMFSDIRGFTTMSEKMSAQENFDFVNEYLKLISPVIQDHEGFIVKFLGDGMMAIFPYGVESALQAGVEKQEKIKEFNAMLQEKGLPSVSVGIGIHTGTMMVGMIGEEYRLQGDAFSDNVNLTSRIEGLNKFFGTSMIISEDTLSQLKDPSQYKMRFLGKAIVKGRLTPLGLYEIYHGLPADAVSLRESTKIDFERGIALYAQGELRAAHHAFQTVLEKDPQDKAAQDYLERCVEGLDQFGNTGRPPAGWDGSLVMDSK